jgi:Cobalamin biosynthesis protein CbiK, Co2+ chelatase
MSLIHKKAILVVSFGTSYHETRMKTINAIEQTIHFAYPEYALYTAWTSSMIIKKVKTRDNLIIPTVCQAMEQIIFDGITELIIQPTHILNGIENDLMILDAMKYKKQIPNISFGAPLLTSTSDYKLAIKGVMTEFSTLSTNEALVFMGHGSSHDANSAYPALNYMLHTLGYNNVYLGTVESYPDFETIFAQIKKHDYKKIILAPFMIVAGDHATNDMASHEDDSWFTLFKNAGYEVECVLKGLGEYPQIRQIFLEHVKTMVE